MKIGVVKEVKAGEYRIALTPSSAQEYISHGHDVLIESSAGERAGFSDLDYQVVGCQIERDRTIIYDSAEMIVHVKEPQEEEFELFHEGQILYTFLHLAANKKVAQFLLEKKVIGVAYETVTADNGTLPLLKPMSQIAGKLSVQEGAIHLETPLGGRGVLLGGVSGIQKGNVVILGGGVAGMAACKVAVGLGAHVTILDRSESRLSYLDDIFGSTITTLHSSPNAIATALTYADLVIGAVLVPGGAKTPILVKREHLATMRPGSVIVDIAIDQGGCAEMSVPTTHQDPIRIVDGIIHYAVANMPSAVAHSATLALSGVTNRYGLLIADNGIEEAVKIPAIRAGLNTYQGALVNNAIAEALGL